MVKKPPSQSRGENSADDKDRGEVISRATGPRTTAGKSRVRYNALKHGVFSSRLVVSERDKESFETLEDDLRKQLRPDTAILKLAFQRVVTAAWRFRQAVEMEARRTQLQPESARQVPEATGDVVDVPRWYLGGPQELNAARRLLDAVREQISVSGGLHLEQMKAAICATFGSAFFSALASMQPKSVDAVLLEETVAAHSQKFTPGSPPKGLGLPVLEDRARWDMMVTFIDMQLQHVADLYKARDQMITDPEQQAGLDTFNRYITSAARELERAVDWYFHLREQAI